ncbi:hypothetical protein [Streptomyces sp. NPDC053048]|uniref:hypothetical protein n=1 Tax=Streptomyces sp. NPDC053048 TaxID=3365694 RepID=UPI0037D3EC0F
MSSAPIRLEVPPGVSAGVAVFDRQAGAFTTTHDAHARFRSASVVKLLIALDHLWSSGRHPLPAGDGERLDLMLRSSDDDAASELWTRNGGAAIVERAAARLRLADTVPPPSAHPGYWGYTGLSAADVVTVYRYLLDEAPASVRERVMGSLRGATRLGTDGFDQSFGIAAAFDRPWAVKQGWSGFDTDGQPRGRAARPTAAAAGDVDLARAALHTTGTVGVADRGIVAVLTLHPRGTAYGRARADLGRLTRSLNVPGAVPAAPPSPGA